MALPGAVTRRTEREAAELREQGIDPNSGTPIAVQVNDPAASAPAAPVASVGPTDDPVALRARIAELEASTSTQNGRVSATATELEEKNRQLELVNGNRTFLESRLGELTEELERLKAEKATRDEQAATSHVDKVAADLNGEGPTEEQLKNFDADAQDFIKRVVNQRLSAVVGPILSELKAIHTALGRVKDLPDKLPQLEESAKVASLEQARIREAEFLRKEVLPHYPDFETVRNKQEWKEYLNQDVPGRGIKVGHLLHSYRQLSNAVGIRAILAGFYDKGKKPTLESLLVPDKTNADVPLAPAAAKIKSSEYKKKLQDFISKKMPKAEWETFRAQWDAAIAAGNVEMDVEIR